MTDEFTPFPKSEPASDFKTIVTEGVKDAANRVSAAIDEGQKPGQPLDLLAKATREAPLGALLCAFLVGALMARRSRW